MKLESSEFKITFIPENPADYIMVGKIFANLKFRGKQSNFYKIGEAAYKFVCENEDIIALLSDI